MNCFKAIFKRELQGYFASPLGYVFLVVFLIGAGYIAWAPGLGGFYDSRQAHLAPLFEFIPYLFVFLVPAIAMRLWAEERRTGTAELLFTMPVTVPQAVLAKFFAAWSVIAIALAMTGTLAATAAYLGKPDWGPVVTGYLDSLLLGGLFLAIGCCCSALSKNQVISFILAVIACIFFLIAGTPPVLELASHVLPGFGLKFVEAHSLQFHFDSMERGVLEFNDLVFYLGMIMAWLAACIFILDYQKAR